MPTAPLPGVLLHYVTLQPAHDPRGRSDVVLVHGLGANLALWYWYIAPALVKRHRVLMFDLRGHGLSSMPQSGYSAQAMAEDLRAHLDFLGVTAAHLLGHSFGGRILVHFACKYPDRVKSLTLADVLLKSIQPQVHLFDWAEGQGFRAALACAGISMAADTQEPSIAILEALARLRLSRRDVAPGMPAFATPFMGHAGRRNAMNWIRLLEQTTARDDIVNGTDPSFEQLSQINKPTLLVYGEYSHAMPTARELRRLWPRARTEVVSRASHFFPIGHPERLLAPVDQFLSAQELVDAQRQPRAL